MPGTGPRRRKIITDEQGKKIFTPRLVSFANMAYKTRHTQGDQELKLGLNTCKSLPQKVFHYGRNKKHA